MKIVILTKNLTVYIEIVIQGIPLECLPQGLLKPCAIDLTIS